MDKTCYTILLYLYFLCRKHIQEINWRRKSEQTEAGNKLKELEDRYMYRLHVALCTDCMQLSLGLFGIAAWGVSDPEGGGGIFHLKN
jgi:hypothetical protein